MKKFLSAFALLLAATSFSTAFAAESAFECLRDDDGDDWSIVVKKDGSLATFWDNDHSIALANQGSVVQRKSNQTIHRLEGNEGEYVTHFAFNEDALKGTLILNMGTADEFKLAMSCEVVKNDQTDWKEVAEVIANKQANDGTRF